MKRFNIISLVAGLMVTGCVLGMDTTHEKEYVGIHTQFWNLAKTSGAGKNFKKKTQNSLLNKSTLQKLRALEIASKILITFEKKEAKKQPIIQLINNITELVKELSNSEQKNPAKSTTLGAPSADENTQQHTELENEITVNPVGPKAVAPKVFSAKGILLHPVFIGAVALSTLAAITYTYLAKKQTKKADDVDTDLDEDTLIS